MGFFQGVAKAYGEIQDRSEREGARKEEREYNEKQRKQTRGWQVEDRDLATAERRRDALVAAGIYSTQTLAGNRKGAENAAGELKASFLAIKDLVGDSERAGEYLETIAKNPSLGPKLLAEISKAQSGLESDFTGDQIIDNFQLYVSEGEVEVMPTPEEIDNLVTNDDAYYTALQKLKDHGVGQGIVLVKGAGLKTKPSSADYQFADERLFGVVKELAWKGGDHADRNFLNTLEKSQSKEKLLEKFGQEAFDRLIAQGGDAATLLPGSVYGSRFVHTEGTEEDQSGLPEDLSRKITEALSRPDLTPEDREAILNTYPSFRTD